MYKCEYCGTKNDDQQLNCRGCQAPAPDAVSKSSDPLKELSCLPSSYMVPWVVADRVVSTIASNGYVTFGFLDTADAPLAKLHINYTLEYISTERAYNGKLFGFRDDIDGIVYMDRDKLTDVVIAAMAKVNVDTRQVLNDFFVLRKPKLLGSVHPSTSTTATTAGWIYI